MLGHFYLDLNYISKVGLAESPVIQYKSYWVNFDGRRLVVNFYSIGSLTYGFVAIFVSDFYNQLDIFVVGCAAPWLNYDLGFETSWCNDAGDSACNFTVTKFCQINGNRSGRAVVGTGNENLQGNGVGGKCGFGCVLAVEIDNGVAVGILLLNVGNRGDDQRLVIDKV
ncbi:MAG: hypothetical protein BWY72_02215 [Bacteroidetes bacterium ADurb.Bin416]|nr:MAG: hypothetical protein BWY72_02215 [Bacteroidetes bacterium ADurb.Bin416]